MFILLLRNSFLMGKSFNPINCSMLPLERTNTIPLRIPWKSKVNPIISLTPILYDFLLQLKDGHLSIVFHSENRTPWNLLEWWNLDNRLWVKVFNDLYYIIGNHSNNLLIFFIVYWSTLEMCCAFLLKCISMYLLNEIVKDENIGRKNPKNLEHIFNN